MQKKFWTLFLIAFIFWIIISSGFNWLHAVIGVFLSIITVWLWYDLGSTLPNILSFKDLLLLARCLLLLVMYIIQSNLVVAKTLLFSGSRVNPVFVIMDPPLTSNWGRVLLATCITITPGTVTIDVDPETGRFIVHALTEETAIGLMYWRLIDEIKNLEEYRQRRQRHVVDTGGAYDSGTIGSAPGDYRPNGH